MGSYTECSPMAFTYRVDKTIKGDVLMNEREKMALQIIDEAVERVKNTLLKARSFVPAENLDKLEPLDMQPFRKGLEKYNEFLKADYERRQEDLKHLSDSYDALAHAIEMQKRFEKGLNK